MKKLVDDFLYEKESYELIRVARNVWRNLGGAFKEKLAENAICIELDKINLKYEKQKPIKIYYDNKYIGNYTPDLIINNCILVELKCKPFISKQDYQQLWHYLKCTEYKVGFVINFSPVGLQFKRVVYDSARKKELASLA